MEPNAQKGNIQKLLSTNVIKKYVVEPEYSFKYMPACDVSKQPAGYTCTILIGEKEFCSNLTYPTKSEAAIETANFTNTILFLRKRQRGSGSRKLKSADKKLLQLKQPEQDWKCLSSIEQLYSYLSDDVLALQFKDLLSNKAHNENKLQPRYDTQLRSEGGFTGYTSVVNYDGKEYGSLGLMINHSQAEQSAAEVCLRNIGHLEKMKSFDDFLIQPYQGGVSKKINTTGVCKYPFIFLSTIMLDALQAFLDCKYMQHPCYYVKELENHYDPREFTVDGQPRLIMDCMCVLEGKVFKASSRQVLRVVKQLTAEDVLNYFRVTHLQERLELKKFTKICTSQLPTIHKEKASGCSPFYYSPMHHLDWKHPCYIKMDTYYDQDIEFLITAGLFMPNPDNCNEKYMQFLVKSEFARNPSFQGVPLSDMNDILVGTVDPIDLNIFVIGNSQFSIKMLCMKGQIFCKKWRRNIQILPGHKIVNLRSIYRATLPSLEIYLKAIECDELIFPDPPLPVVTSCGVVVMLHDHETSPNDIFVLLRTRATGFAARSLTMSVLFNKLLEPEQECSLTPPLQCIRDIKEWNYWEVKLLSEMTMDSVYSLMSKYVGYDDRWNELFTKEKLPDILLELQEICLKVIKTRDEEVKRRGEGSDEDAEECILWDLPDSEMITRFESIGIHIEDSNLCAFRAVRESTGIRIKYGDIEKAETVDIAVKDDKQHSGVVNRYYIWKGCQKYPVLESYAYYDEVDTDELAAAGDWDLANDQCYESGPSALRYEREAHKKRRCDYNGDVAEEMENMEESVQDGDANEGSSERNQYISYNHCFWMKLNEAIDACPVLLSISQTEKFKHKLNDLIVESNDVLKIKGVDQQLDMVHLLNPRMEYGI